MRARAREINIFNMSLLDILCGALGAFCFMMLVLLPYYKPPGKATDLHKQEVETQDLLRQLEQLRENAKDAALAQQMADTMRKLDEELKQMQGQLNQLTAENDRLNTENQNLTARNQKQSGQIAMHHPFLTVAVTNPAQDLDVYLDSDGMTEEKKSNPPFDPTKPHQSTFFLGDLSGWWTDHGATVWMTRDTPVGVHYKLYVKIPQASDSLAAFTAPPATTVKSMAIGDGWRVDVPDVTLSPARFWTLVGTFSVTSEGKMAFKEATQAERDAEWTKLSKTTPPPAVKPTATGAPVMPFSSPAAQSTATGAAGMPFSGPAALPSATPRSPEEWHAYMEKIEKERREQQQRQSPPASPSASP
jgi:hypothetical protein